MIAVYLFGLFWTMALKLKREDSITIVIEALDKNIYLALIAARYLPGFDPDSLNIFPSSVVIATPIVLLIHLMREKLG